MFNFDPNDPRQAGLMNMALALMANKSPNLGRAIGESGLMGINAYHTTRGLNDRRKEEGQQAQMRQMAIAERQRMDAEQQQIRDLGRSAFAPPQVAPNDPYGEHQTPGGGGAREFAQGLMGINPMLGMQMMPKPAAPLVLGKGARAFDSSGREIASNPEAEKKESLYGKVNVSDYTPESVRKFAASGNHADLVPYRAPVKPDGPIKPQLYDGPEGPVWVTPPQAGQSGATVPVTDPSGNPLSAKKRNTPLTESQAKGTLFLGQMREAEKAITGLKFKPETSTAQAQLAAALRAKEAPGFVSAVALNLASGKDAQQYAQAAEQWSEAFLRIKTGAASTRDEVLRNIRTFFPQPGDNAATIKQKNEMRAAANKQMEIIAGQGVQQLDAQSGSRVIDFNDLP